MHIERSILHVDDDPQTTRIVAQYLESYGYRVSAFHDPAAFLKKLPQSEERVVILDLDMPQLSGLEVLQRLKAFDGGIQVVMLTGVVAMSTVLDSLRWGAEACFFKPLVEIRPLVDAIDACFQKIERWWESLDELSRRRRLEAEGCANLRAALPPRRCFQQQPDTAVEN